ncbi:unnamed protein product [Closterium sp. Naga37s-1]|nr:unnamed protein product [Closterium sp. Naga37s-1]
MRVKRQREVRRHVRFYRTSCGFREPFKAVADGTFLHHVTRLRLSPLATSLPKLLGFPTRPTSPSSLSEREGDAPALISLPHCAPSDHLPASHPPDDPLLPSKGVQVAHWQSYSARWAPFEAPQKARRWHSGGAAAPGGRLQGLLSSLSSWKDLPLAPIVAFESTQKSPGGRGGFKAFSPLHDNMFRLLPSHSPLIPLSFPCSSPLPLLSLSPLPLLSLSPLPLLSLSPLPPPLFPAGAFWRSCSAWGMPSRTRALLPASWRLPASQYIQHLVAGGYRCAHEGDEAVTASSLTTILPYPTRCSHEGEEAVTASQCIQHLVSGGNHQHFFVASQDIEFKKLLKKVPAVPIISANGTSISLEPPSPLDLSLSRFSLFLQALFSSPAHLPPRQVPAVPIISANGTSISLEPPSPLDLSLSKKSESARLGLPEHEQQQLLLARAAKRKKRIEETQKGLVATVVDRGLARQQGSVAGSEKEAATGGETGGEGEGVAGSEREGSGGADGAGAEEGGGEAGGVNLNADAYGYGYDSEEEGEERKPEWKRLGYVKDRAKFKRKRVKGPNPLSCKKKARPTTGAASERKRQGEEGEGARKRPRRRRKGGQGGEGGAVDGGGE